MNDEGNINAMVGWRGITIVLTKLFLTPDSEGMVLIIKRGAFVNHRSLYMADK